MSASNPAFVEWEEHIICHEKGNRVIHFYLKDASGNSVLAVIGTERSIRHMMYVVSDEFLQAYGSKVSFTASKWRARREVVDWLTSVVSRHPVLYLRKHVELKDSKQDVESLDISTSGMTANQACLPDQLVLRKLKCQSSDIEWSGIAWFCAKQLKHYLAFCRNGTIISVHSFVYIMAEEEGHYLGYLEDMYEDKKGLKKVKVRWFHLSQEVKGVVPQLNPHPREVFITPHVQVISAECVNGPATVLTPNHYEKCLAVVLDTTSSGFHMCYRQFKNNKLKPFSLTKLRGYCNQRVLSCLDGSILPQKNFKCHKFSEVDEEDLTEDDLLRPTNKRNGSRKKYEEPEIDFAGVRNCSSGNEMTKCEPTYPRLKLRLSRKTMGIKAIGHDPHYPSFKVGEKIELLCQDSGIRGCWFRCKILNTSPKQLKVQYDDVQDADGPWMLEEWVSAPRVAAPDKLGMRCSGRLTVRPHPPKDSTDCTYETGAPVDAWWSDGWWEGVVTGIDVSGNSALQVYFPGEDRLLTVDKKNVRVSRDWIHNRWVDIMVKPDIVDFVSPNVSSGIKLSTCSAMADRSRSIGSAVLESKVLKSPKVESVQKDGLNSSGLDASNDLENLNVVSLDKRLQMIDEEEHNDSVSGSDDENNKDDHDNMQKQLQMIDEEEDNNSVSGCDGNNKKGDNDGDSVDETDDSERTVDEGKF
ncbi:putative Agenet domain-containing protein / bromo-adjacent domain-containing protein [Quillaja saponaria]|uniref:Agenet domain-containing protein / bromo-adjacent domain-containing protein n=1 Tax=Quillaja saponaria TaxID=32244 RepID=A0AAD7P8J1_QUISA|nr:putative Agenet domain-containing protein / bromo-adjacent domain-containing protein [Quillaja saponaria]